MLVRGDHHCIYLQNAWNKYGKEAFEFIILEYCSEELLLLREDYYLKDYKGKFSDNFYNICIFWY